MAKYINADALAKRAYEVAYPIVYDNNSHERGLSLMGIAQILDEMATADVRENVRGEWEIMEDADGCKYYRCSACHRFRFHNGAMLKKYRFCPICGADNRSKTTSADMRGEER